MEGEKKQRQEEKIPRCLNCNILLLLNAVRKQHVNTSGLLCGFPSKPHPQGFKAGESNH